MNVLEYENVTKRYGHAVHALNGLSMSVPAGALFGFIGLNGAGKTTSIRILAGLTGKDAGSVRVFGKELADHDPSYKGRIGFVLDEPLYFEWMDLKEYLYFVGAMYGLARPEIEHRVGELITFFDLDEKADAPIGTCSTGMKKKISLAAAIIHKPELIILDEPLEGIDAVAASTIKETLTLMASKGTTILITSHVLDTVERLCTDVAIVHEGKVVLECRTADIRSRVKGALANQTYESLEDLFVDIVADKACTRHLSWL